MGTCAQVYVDAWRRQDKCAHDKQTAILKKKKKQPLSEERYAKRNHDE